MFQGIYKSAIKKPDTNANYIFGTGSIPIQIKSAQLATFADGTTKQQGYEVAEVNKLISTMLTGWDADGNKPKSMSDNYLELILSCDNGFVVKKRLQFPHIIAWQNDSTPYNIADVYKEFSVDNWLKADDFENPDITLVVEPTDEILTSSTAIPPEVTTTNSGRFYLYYRNLPVGINRIHIDFHIKTRTEPIDFDLEVIDGLSLKDAETIIASNAQAKINVLLDNVKDVYKFSTIEDNFEDITMYEWSALYQKIISLNTNNKFTHDLFFVIIDEFIYSGMIAEGAITANKIANDAITTDKIADKSVTVDKTDFVEIKPGNQLYDKSSMGVKGSWYYFAGEQGIGKEVSLITNEDTKVYTAIKIPYNGQNQITISQDIPEQNGAKVYAYFIVDTNMCAIAYQLKINKYLVEGYTITIDNAQDAAYLLLSVIKCNDDSFMVNEGNVALPYEPYQTYTYINGIKITNDQEVLKEEIDISLPDTIHAVVGDTLQLFYRGIVKAVNPYNYDILISCSKGKQYPRYYEFTPTSEDVGSIPFKITIKDNNRNIITQKSCIINVVNVASSPASVKKIACFGDSLTIDGIWVAEAYRRLTQNGGSPVANGLSNIDFVGAKENNGARYFGEGGWTWNSYTTKGINAYRFQVNNVSSLSVGSQYTNNGNTFTIMEINITDGSGNILCSVPSLTPAPSASGTLIKSRGTGDDNITFTSYSQDSANPLWDSNANKMTFIPYANKYADGNLDIVYTLLSWNGQIPGKEDFSDVISKIKIFADTLHSEFPNAKLKIMGIQVPSVNGGMGANYGATGISYSDGYGMVVTALNQNKAYQDFANQDNYKSFVEFVNISSQFDSEYNMPQAEVNVNTRSTIKEKRGTNGVHPSNEGYMQIADVVYRNMMANL